MKRLFPALLLFLQVVVSLHALEPAVSASIQGHQVTIRMVIPSGMYSYVGSAYSIPVSVTVPPKFSRFVGLAVLPPGKAKDGDLIIKGTVDIVLPVMPGTRPADLAGLNLDLAYQLCDELQNVCLPPKTVTLAVPLGDWQGVPVGQTTTGRDPGAVSNQDGSLTRDQGAGTSGTSQKPTTAPRDESLTETLARLVEENIASPLVAFLLAFLGGFLASLTPCVYPVIPVTLAFFAGRESAQAGAGSGGTDGQSGGQRSARRRRFAGAVLYVAGMGLVYTVLGLVAGLAGGAFGSIVSTPPFFVAVAVLFIALALSLFDVWELRMPAFVERLKHGPAKKGGGAGSALAMGAVTGLVASPCVGPIVFFILTGVMQRGEPVYGAFLMVGFSLGIGLLFLVLALASGRISRLPKSGNWMIRIKMVFGALVLMSGLYFLGQALTGHVPLVLQVMAYLLIANTALIAGWTRLAKLYGEQGRHGPVLGLIVTLALAVFLLTQASTLFPDGSSGKTDPLSGWNIGLDEGLRKARETGKPVLVDVGAVWCTVCRELKTELARNPAVRGHIEQHAIPVYVDYDAHKARMEGMGVTSLPWVMLLDGNGSILWKKSGFDRLAGLFAEISNTLPYRAVTPHMD
ncbi:MAG TPA: cytochrome c biogenesis protein CcdA [Spirochaetota bacterium]|nr:cytochrome c biogenesis protein CcdA [Spirochaetota bacterium]